MSKYLSPECVNGCRGKSRFDPYGNVVTLYTCKVCLLETLEYIKSLPCKSIKGVIQLVLFEDVSQLADGVDEVGAL